MFCAYYKALYRAFSENCSMQQVSTYELYFVCSLSAFLWIFFTQTVEGAKGELMRCYRP